MITARPRWLACACCGGPAGRWQQHWNQDTGGACVPCIDWMRGRGTSEAELTDLYGKQGVSWGPEKEKARMNIVDAIRTGDRVTIVNRFGQTATAGPPCAAPTAGC